MEKSKRSVTKREIFRQDLKRFPAVPRIRSREERDQFEIDISQKEKTKRSN
jgi:hypothetical protein